MKRIKPSTWALLGLGAVIAILGVVLWITLPAAANPGYQVLHRGWQSPERGQTQGFHMVSGHGLGLSPLLGFGLIMVGITVVLLLRKRTAGEPAESAVDILRKEFAEGRITEDEYLERKKVLEEEAKP